MQPALDFALKPPLDGVALEEIHDQGRPQHRSEVAVRQAV
jgi:hypothetical protein